MAKLIKLSQNSRKLIEQLTKILDEDTLQQWNQQKDQDILRIELVTWLKEKIVTNERTRLQLESLRASLLIDLHASFLNRKSRIKKVPSSWLSNTEFQLLIISGAMIAICEGFNGITAILGTFTIPTLAIVSISLFVAGIAFALFYHYDRVEMSNTLGAKIKQPHQLLDVCTEEITLFNRLRRDIDECYLSTTDITELEELHQMAKMVNARFESLNDLRRVYLAKLNNPFLKTIQAVTATAEGFIVLAGGFFAGKALGIAAASFVGATAATAFWPIFAAGVVMSLAYFGVFWFVKRSGFQNRIGGLLGLDKEKIIAFADTTIVNKQSKKLQRLEKGIADKLQSYKTIENLSKKMTGLEQPEKSRETHPTQTLDFFKRSSSPEELNLECALKQEGLYEVRI